jgi:hypothetical protein
MAVSRHSQRRPAKSGTLAIIWREKNLKGAMPVLSRPFYLICVCTLIWGCSSERLIDRQTMQLVDDRTAMIGGGAIPPQRHPPIAPDPGSLRDPSITSKQVPTTNPAPGDLRFKVADEARDVAKRLEAMQALDEEHAAHLNLTGALKQAQITAREHLNREEEYIVAAIGVLIERHAWEPRLTADSTVSFDSTQVDGASTTALKIINQLQATQQLPYGGQVAARWVWNATENLRSAATGQYVQSSRLVLDGNVPLLRGAGLVAQEGLIQSERNLVYGARDFEQFRRDFLVSIARDFYDLVQTQKSIKNSRARLESLQKEQTKRQALFEAGRIKQLEVNNIGNQLRQAEASVANQREGYILQLDRFKIRLGLPVRTPMMIDDEKLDVPEPDVTFEEATLLALTYRLDLQNQRDRLDDVRRSVKNARNRLLPDLNLAASVAFPTDADAREGGVVYEPDDVSYGASVTFGLPLDRRVERLQLRQSMIGLQRSVRDYDKFRDDLVLDVRAKVRAIELARTNLLLAIERVHLTELRKREQDIRADEVDTQSKLDTINDLLDAENARDASETALRNSVLDYLLATGQLRVSREGQLERLPGMEDAKPP